MYAQIAYLGGRPADCLHIVLIAVVKLTRSSQVNVLARPPVMNIAHKLAVNALMTGSTLLSLMARMNAPGSFWQCYLPSHTLTPSLGVSCQQQIVITFQSIVIKSLQFKMATFSQP